MIQVYKTEDGRYVIYEDRGQDRGGRDLLLRLSEEDARLLQKQLNHALIYNPKPAGWGGGK